ncbi:hypothetical protein Hanom_Chr12g01099781 [Helianthus anomalus]
MFTSNCRRCPLVQKLTNFVLNVLKSCTLYPLDQTQLIFLIKYGHVPCTCLAHEGILVISLSRGYCANNIYV